MRRCLSSHQEGLQQAKMNLVVFLPLTEQCPRQILRAWFKCVTSTAAIWPLLMAMSNGTKVMLGLPSIQ